MAVQFNTAGPNTSGTINRQAWSRVVYTYLGSDFRVFVNGVEVYAPCSPPTA